MADNTDQQSDFCCESEDAGSTYEEDRVKKLFQACDGDGDGYIDSGDLLAVCRELRLELSLDELLRELGADADGRVSCRDFVRKRAALRPEIDALRRRGRDHDVTQSDASLQGGDVEGAGAGRQESWEFDSGLARDSSPEPHALRSLVAASGSSSGNMLQLASELHLAALAALKSEVLDLSAQLHECAQERAYLARALAEAELRAEAQAQEQAQAHEERVTELHCVIAELRKTIERQRSQVIEEEDDEQPSELEDVSGADLHGSSTHLADESEPLDHDRTQADDSEAFENDRTLGDADSSSADIDARAVEAGLNIASLSPPRKEMATSCNSLQVAALTDETLQLKAQAATQQAQLVAQRDELMRARSALAGLRADRDRLRKKLREAELTASTPPSDTVCRPPSPPTTSMAVVPQDEMPVCKMAERVSLRKLDTHVTGSQLTALGVWSSCVAESLVCEVRDAADLQEAGRELEAERLAARYENARAQNAVLAITLHEAKAQGDRLSLLLAKFESNATALRLALGYSDRATEAYDVLVALLETELGLLLANCRGAAGLGDKLGAQAEEELAGVLRRAAENRRAAETVAGHLLARLDRALAGNAIDISAAPWEEYSPASLESAPWAASSERRLRDHIGRLKAERSVVRATAVQLESSHAESVSVTQPITLAEARKLDLETAVLMQEVMALREDKAELRARLFLAEKERASLELRMSAQDGQRAAQAAALAHLQAQMLDSDQLLERLSQEGGLLDGEGELAAALCRESRLKQRLTELAASLDQSGQAGELRNRHAAELAGHLKAANAALAQTLDRTKKKYQARLRRLEQQMLAMVERHSQQVRTLEQRIGEGHVRVGGSLSHSSAASETSL